MKKKCLSQAIMLEIKPKQRLEKAVPDRKTNKKCSASYAAPTFNMCYELRDGDSVQRMRTMYDSMYV